MPASRISSAATPGPSHRPAALMKITAGIKASFDPDAILNPGRMYEF